MGDEGYIEQWYNGVYDPVQATLVDIIADEITEDIDAELTLGIEILGTVSGPEGEIPENDEIFVEGISGTGSRFSFNVVIDDDGNWYSYQRVPPGFYTLMRESWSDNGWASGFMGGSPLYWEVDWQMLESGDEGEFDIVFNAGALIAGTVTGPGGDPVDDAEVTLYMEMQETMSRGSFENGYYVFPGVPEGSYIIKVVLESGDGEEEGGELNDVDPDRPWPAIFSGEAFGIEDAEPFEVEAGEEYEFDFQFVEGGILHVNIMNPDGMPYDAFEMNAGVMPFALGVDGSRTANEPTSSDGPFGDPEGIDIVLPVGDYHVGGLPIFIPVNPDAIPPDIRRTLYEGDDETGGFTDDNAEVVTISEGEYIEIDLMMAEEGYTVSGSLSNDVDLIGISPVMILLDEDDLWVAASANFVFSYEPEYQINGIPDGDYKLLAMVGESDPSFLVSTWYPDISDPGANFDRMMPHDDAEAFEVDGEDVEGIDINIRTVEFVQDVPLKQKIAVIKGYRLANAYPNPFNNSTRLSFTLPHRSHVQLAVYNVLGRKVAEVVNNRFEAGTHFINFDAKYLASGIYFLKMKAGDYYATRKLILMK